MDRDGKLFSYRLIYNLAIDLDGDGYFRTICYPHVIGIQMSREAADLKKLANWLKRMSYYGYKDCPETPPKLEPEAGDQPCMATVYRRKCIYNLETKKTTSAWVGDNPPTGYSFDCYLVDLTIEPTIESTIEVFPNPATSQLNIFSKKDLDQLATISLVDPFGREVRVQRGVRLYKGQKLSINTADLKSGIYRLIIQTNKGVESKNVAIKL